MNHLCFQFFLMCPFLIRYPCFKGGNESSIMMDGLIFELNEIASIHSFLSFSDVQDK